MQEAKRALFAAMAREVELSQTVKASRVKVNVVEDQASIAFSCILSLEDEWQRRVAPSGDEIMTEAWDLSHQDTVGKVKE